MGIFEELKERIKIRFGISGGHNCNFCNAKMDFMEDLIEKAEAKAKAMIERLRPSIPSDPEYQISEEEFYTNETLDKLEKELFGEVE